MAEKKTTLSELIENGKAKGKLTTKEITDFIEEMDFEVEQVDKLYDILESNNNNTRAILDFLTQDKISTLQAENQALKFQASQTAQNAFITANQDAQTAELIRRLGADCPVPAYVVPNPNCCYNYAVTGFGYGNNGCNCGNF